MPTHLAGALTNGSPAATKIALFRALFRGRDDVFVVRWIGKDGKAGYSPAALKDWSQLDAKGRPARTFLPLTDDGVVAHLTGRQTNGVHPLLSDETCWFLAADFDKTGWQDDARTFLCVCHEWGVAAAIERSRSGRGGHVCGCVSPKQSPQSWLASSVRRCSRARWNGGIKSGWIRMTAFSRIRTRCRKVGSEISSPCRSNMRRDRREIACSSTGRKSRGRAQALMRLISNKDTTQFSKQPARG